MALGVAILTLSEWTARLAQLDHDFDWELIPESLLPDRDHELLYSPAFDGVESDDELQQCADLGDSFIPTSGSSHFATDFRSNAFRGERVAESWLDPLRCTWHALAAGD